MQVSEESLNNVLFLLSMVNYHGKSSQSLTILLSGCLAKNSDTLTRLFRVDVFICVWVPKKVGKVFVICVFFS